MDVYTVPLLDDLQLVVEGRRLRRELRLLVTDIVHPHDDCGSVEEFVVLQEPEGKPVLADHQLRGRDQYLERSPYRCSGLGCDSPSLCKLGAASGDQENQHDHTADRGLGHCLYSWRGGHSVCRTRRTPSAQAGPVAGQPSL